MRSPAPRHHPNPLGKGIRGLQLPPHREFRPRHFHPWLSDTDLLAVFRKTAFTWGDSLINSDTALDKVRVALAERYPYSNVYRDGIAIAVSFSDGRHVDVVPAVFDTFFKEKWPVYLIADGAGGWMPTSPALYDAYLANANKESGGKLTYVAQLMKFWRECRDPRIPISSFHIEMVLAYEDVCKGVKPYSECMLEILRSLARRECRAMRDPYGIAGNIPAVRQKASASAPSLPSPTRETTPTPPAPRKPTATCQKPTDSGTSCSTIDFHGNTILRHSREAEQRAANQPAGLREPDLRPGKGADGHPVCPHRSRRPR